MCTSDFTGGVCLCVALSLVTSCGRYGSKDCIKNTCLEGDGQMTDNVDVLVANGQKSVIRRHGGSK